MARVKSMGLRNYVGKLGGAVYYMSKGQNIGRELAPEISNPRTSAQMRQRMQWANLVNTYKVNKGWMGHLSFENKKQTWSDYNAFMSANLQSTPVYLTKQQAESGTAILAPYIVTKGSIPTVPYTVRENWNGLMTNIKADTLTTLADLSTAIVNSEQGWKNGDQFSIIIEEDFNLDGSLIRVWPIEIILDVNDTTPLSQIDTFWDISLGDLFSVETVGDDTYIAVSLSDVPRQFNWAAAIVHSRTVSGKTYVSTQAYALSQVSYQNYIAKTTDQALQDAIASYGESTEYFLEAPQRPTSETQIVSSVTGTYQSDSEGNMGGFVINRGGINTFKKGYTDTSTIVTIETNENIDNTTHNLDFHVAGSESVISSTAYSRISDKLAVFSFVYEDAEAIDGVGGEFWFRNSTEVLDKIPVTAP